MTKRKKKKPASLASMHARGHELFARLSKEDHFVLQVMIEQYLATNVLAKNSFWDRVWAVASEAVDQRLTQHFESLFRVRPNFDQRTKPDQTE